MGGGDCFSPDRACRRGHCSIVHAARERLGTGWPRPVSAQLEPRVSGQRAGRIGVALGQRSLHQYRAARLHTSGEYRLLPALSVADTRDRVGRAVLRARRRAYQRRQFRRRARAAPPAREGGARCPRRQLDGAASRVRATFVLFHRDLHRVAVSRALGGSVLPGTKAAVRMGLRDRRGGGAHAR